MCRLICVAVVTLLSSTSHAFTIDSLDYELTTVTGTFAEHSTELMSQDWWDTGDNYTYFDSYLDVYETIGADYFFAVFNPYTNGSHIACSGGDNSASCLYFYNGDSVNGGPEITREWVVRDNISSVPVPAAAWLFGSALVGLIGFKRKREGVAVL